MNKIIVSDKTSIDLGLTLRRYIAFGEDAANLFDGTIFRKVFDFGDALYLLTLFEQPDGIVLQIEPETKDTAIWREAEKIARKLLGLDSQLEAFYQFSQNDPVLAALTKKFTGARPTLSATPFEMLVTSITAQQINLQFAYTTRSRLIREYGKKLNLNGQTYFAFPLPETLTNVRVENLREMQFSTRKAGYIIDLSKAIVSGDLNLEVLENLPDDEISEKLTGLRGIGRWTVDWFLARYLGRGHAFPAGDLGVRKAVEHYYFDGEKLAEEKLREFAGRWGEFTNLVVHYLLLGFYSEDK